MPELITPTVRLHEAWLESRDEWGRGVHQPGSGLRLTDDPDTHAGFAAWTRRLVSEEDPAVTPEAGWVNCSYRWVVEDDRVLGAISLRHVLNDFLLNAGGHIGYGIRPSARRRGLASFAVAEMLTAAGKLGIDRVMISCDVANEASARTIERNGGVLEDIRITHLGTVKRYWITL
ncbi:GNAT family N-acetyltransferase [Actinoplanes sp. CA-015351]|uniref:GNAT family N-acetyltransferase n=1 Tax=Actinoplanes sp. CA-015351 TaxID=3239897 RepID=UPI003D98DA8D